MKKWDFPGIYEQFDLSESQQQKKGKIVKILLREKCNITRAFARFPTKKAFFVLSWYRSVDVGKT